MVNSYFWPTLFKDTFEHVHSCHTFQTTANRERHVAMPLQPMFKVHPFSKWWLDFIGPVKPLSSTRHMFILTTTDYCTC